MGTRAWAAGWVALVVAAACAESSSDPPGPNGTSGTGGAASAGAGGSSPSTGGGSGQPGAGSSGSGGSTAKPRLVQSGSRLEAVVYRGADGSQHPTGRWFDVQRGEECTFQPAADGAVRCLPSGVSFGSLYHGGCTKMAVEVDACGVDVPYVTVASAPEACAAPVGPRVFRKGTQLPASTSFYRVNGSGQCTQVSTPLGLLAFTVEDEVPPAEFVAATVERLAP